MVGKAREKCAKCGITSKENSSLTYHRFPLPSIHGPLKARVWAKFCFPNDDWTSDESLVKLYKQHMMLCGNHFDDSSYTSSAKTRLNKFAIPAEAQNILAQLRDKPKKAKSSQKENTRTCCMCGSSPCNDPSISLHRFPKPGSKNALRCELWAKYCFPNEAWSSPQFQDALHSKHKMLCSKHFKSTCFIEKNLFRTAVPGFQCHKDTIINLPDQPAILEAVAGPSSDNSDHNYSKKEDFGALVEEDPVVAREHPVDHLYLKSAPSPTASSILNTDFTTVNILESSEIPLTSECVEYVMQIDSLETEDQNLEHPVDHTYLKPAASSILNTDFTTVNILESSEIPLTSECVEYVMQIDSLETEDITTFSVVESSELPLTSECEESLHVIEIDSLETQGIDSQQNLLFNSFGSDHLQPNPSFGSDHLQPNPSFGSDHLQPNPSFGSDNLQPKPSFGSDHLQPKPSFGSDHLQPKPSFGSDHLQPKPSFGSDHLQPKPSFMAERYRFRQRKQNDDESIIQYISELVSLSQFCDFKTALEDNLRDQLVCGLRSDKIRHQLFAEESLDYIKAVVIACAMEAAETGVGVVEQTVGTNMESGEGEVATKVLHGDSAGDAQTGLANNSRNNCSVCGATDHQEEDCRQNRFVCALSKQKGHLNLVCPMRPGGRQQGRCDTDGKEAHVPVASRVTGQLDLVEQLGEDKPPSSDRGDREIEDDEQQLSRKGYKRLVIWVDEAQLPMDIDMESIVSCIKKT